MLPKAMDVPQREPLAGGLLHLYVEISMLAQAVSIGDRSLWPTIR